MYTVYRTLFYLVVKGSTSTSTRTLQRSKQLHKLQDVISKNTSFPCDVKGWRSNVTPTSVHRLKPGDIDIIASMGDSLSAGTGMFGSNLIDLFIDNRGTAAAGGGQDTWREYVTLPNILKIQKCNIENNNYPSSMKRHMTLSVLQEFNPNLYGYSMGDYSTLEKGSKLNIAEAGGMSRDMPYMASILVKRLKSDPHVNLQKHWKHISLMVGSNDFCLYMCTTSTDEFLANHERDMVETLRILRDNIPRVFVSFIPPPNLKILINKQINGRPSLYCDLLLDFECPCLFGLLYRNKREEYYKIMESVHRLRPGDIDVIGGLGDSLVAGSGALEEFAIGTFIEARGVSWCAGGQDNWRRFLTLPNLLKVFNPNLTGYSTGTGEFVSSKAKLNIAFPVSVTKDAIQQARILVQRIRNDPKIDFTKHWKLITILFGANDICSGQCNNPEQYSPLRHAYHLKKVLDYLKMALPRTLVNLVPTIDVTVSLRVKKSITCRILHPLYCSCMHQGLRPDIKASKISMINKGSYSLTNEDEESLQAMSDIYGQTPPRTRLSRKKRHMKQRLAGGETKSLDKECRPKFVMKRKNTLDTIIFNVMCDEADKCRENEAKEEVVKEGNRKCKRSLKLLRGNERDLKLDVEAALNYAEKSECLVPYTPNNMKIETKNRFRSLRSKPIDVEEKKQETKDLLLTVSSMEEKILSQSPMTKSYSERQNFYETFSFIIKLGNTERNCRRQMSHEETRWQNELKDLIWLELQARHADRSPMAQDEYLCKQREAVGSLLKEIIEYRYNTTVNRSPISPYPNYSNKQNLNFNTCMGVAEQTSLCSGCLSMYCRPCVRSQGEALRQVEGLLARLEAAEALYPSSQAFATHYPLYKSPEFTGRVKAMCLWYNMTKHHRLKLQILGKLLMMLHTKKKQDETSDSGISSRGSDMTDNSEPRRAMIRFELSQQDEVSNPSDSNNSNNSSLGGMSLAQSSWPSTPESSFPYIDDERLDRFDFYLVEFDRLAYRKYIEDVLKTRGLRKSLNFLERLHTSVLRKARLTLEKNDENDNDSANEEYDGDMELKRYGVWSPEAKELNLPSYRAAFVFLSRVPLDVVHEFLRMRLEQKPEQPSPLSVRQLMRELREGLRIACIHRDRFSVHSRTAIASDLCACDTLFEAEVREFDESLKAVFEVYLNYLQQWVDMVQHDSFHKNLIMDEWIFVKSIAGDIIGGYKIAGVKFCEIVRTMIMQVKEFLVERPKEIKESVDEREDDDEWSGKFHLMYVGREWQGMFVEAREKVVKSVTLAKCLKRDIEKWPGLNNELEEALIELKKVVMDLRHRIAIVIEDFQNDLNQAEEPNSECDLTTMRSRIREILHQAYKMGFDYYKEMCKLFMLEEKAVLTRGLVSFALLWMEFVKTRCERGRGLRPRWANQGFEFLILVCEPHYTKHLTNEEFEELKTSMDRCISHVIGTVSSVSPSDVDGLKRLPRSRASSPAHSRSRTASISTQKSRDVLKSPELLLKKSISPSPVEGNLTVNLNMSREDRIVKAIKTVDDNIDERLKNQELIGQVTDKKAVDRVRIKARQVTFTWQRGIKIGQGRFGKVYTVVNNQTGELLAMKEVQLQPGDHRAIRRVAEELQIFEGIQDNHLVRYYGLEIHREEMLIFMEFCAEGTLESLVAGSGNGLPESLVRKYTHQLLLAVAALHSHGIVHRDIKTANIFLTNEGNCLKLGDFGSAVQIKAHTTMPGELQGFVGTQAYMAPEVFMKTENIGHGRAVDIWSVGCCIIEMASGRRPWSEYDSNYQIMFKVGMGETPAVPKTLSLEGIDLIKKCLQHDPKKRYLANTLLTLPFAQTYEDVNADLTVARF
ncbi:hypothetical protein M0802_006004 [Mischocyttarus mexicanus]|nr:hypothetical protein M0802_006004 [Mischocyttarus mexicanus]